MRIGVITDIHGTPAALEAALGAIEVIGADEVYCGGDLVGDGPHPNRVCALIEDRGIPTIHGNDDSAIGRERTDCGCAYITPHDRALGHESLDWTRAHANDRSKAFMRCLPVDLCVAMGDQRIRLVPGSPRTVNEYLFEDAPESLYTRLAASADCDVLVFGPTDKPWIHTYGGVRFVNCGSAGKPKDDDPRGALAILELADGRVEASLERVPHDAEAVAREVAAVGLPSEFAAKLVAAA
jgi:predicted phosphodiesterase